MNVAAGMLAAELRISIDDAFLRLRAHAFSHDLPLLDVARAVLGRQLGTDSFDDRQTASQRQHQRWCYPWLS